MHQNLFSNQSQAIDTVKWKPDNFSFWKNDPERNVPIDGELCSRRNKRNNESFFNLTNCKINQQLIENLKLGKKYTPKTKYYSTVEITKFNSEIANIFKSLIHSEFGRNVEINTSDLIKSLRDILKGPFSDNLKAFIKNAIQAFKQELQLIKKHPTIEHKQY